MIAALIAVSFVASSDVASSDPAPQGVWLHAAVGGGGVGGDVVAGVEAGVGLETEPFAVHLDVPLMLRVVDLDPVVDPGLPAACRFVRCEEWLDAGALSAESLGRAVEEIRVGHAGDTVYVKGGRLYASLGHGALVDEYTNVAEWDRRHSGLYVRSDLPWGKTSIEALTGDFLAPQDLIGARVSTSPLAPTPERAEDADALDRFLGRMRLGFEAAGDFDAPTAVDASGDVIPGARTFSLVGAGADLTWPLLDDDGAFQLAPYLGASGERGLGGNDAFGAGAQAGLELVLDAVFVAVRADASGFVDSAGHRTAPFDTLYDVDRRRYARASGGFADDGIDALASPGGAGTSFGAELVVMRAVKAGARAFLDHVPDARRAEAYLEVDAGSVRVDARVLERAFTDGSALVDGITPGTRAFTDRGFVVVDAAWQVWPPFSLFVRWLHGPRFHDVADANHGRGEPGADDDVFVGASFDLVLAPG